jgi:hypothetical protein
VKERLCERGRQMWGVGKDEEIRRDHYSRRDSTPDVAKFGNVEASPGANIVEVIYELYIERQYRSKGYFYGLDKFLQANHTTFVCHNVISHPSKLTPNVDHIKRRARRMSTQYVWEQPPPSIDEPSRDLQLAIPHAQVLVEWLGLSSPQGPPSLHRWGRG